jgi:hypothetical protein
MRSNLYGPEAFLLKSKKPRIQALVADVGNITVEDIEKLDEKPDIKLGLMNIKKKQNQDATITIAMHLADIMTAKYHPELSRQDNKD